LLVATLRDSFLSYPVGIEKETVECFNSLASEIEISYQNLMDMYMKERA
jgi:hypothetical protein